MSAMVKTIYPLAECDTLEGMDLLTEELAMPRPKPTIPTRFVGFRMPEALYQALADLAKRETRSINAQLVVLLREALHVDERESPAPQLPRSKKKRASG